MKRGFEWRPLVQMLVRQAKTDPIARLGTAKAPVRFESTSRRAGKTAPVSDTN